MLRVTLGPESMGEAALKIDLLRELVPAPELALALPLIEEISRLKRERRAVVLAHNYQIPAIYHGIADYTGDSLGLSYAAAATEAETIVFCGVHFMAETAKIVNPAKTVLLPDMKAGCSLSESITAADVRALKARHPGMPVVCYVNTEADIKAESDICCTSANAVKVVESLAGDSVIFVPDGYLARNVATQTRKRVVWWEGRCMVHEQFTVEQIASHRAQFPGLRVVAHPECSPEVVAAADYAGSTAQMIDYLRDRPARKVMLITECSMASNIREQFPETDFQMPCTLCPHMKRITLEKVARSLREGVYPIEVPEPVQTRARRAIEAMLAIGR
ncbi:MAG: quinolinate synthase NadA [Deltaproteobacteria bacterium]|nr:quinolinate synthase NadA [Deltaproteobacteria bacterium]